MKRIRNKILALRAMYFGLKLFSAKISYEAQITADRETTQKIEDIYSRITRIIQERLKNEITTP